MPQDSATGRKLTPRGERTRNQLLSSARKVFEKDGFANARITDIADMAGAAHGTFYTYFDSKEEIFQTLIRTVVQDDMLNGHPAQSNAADEQGDEQGDEPWAAVARANRRYLAAYRANRDIMVIWEQAASMNVVFQEMLTESRNKFTARVERSILTLQASGDVDPDIDPLYAATALGGMVSRFSYIWATGQQEFDLDMAVFQLTRIWCNALGIPHGQQKPVPASAAGA